MRIDCRPKERKTETKMPQLDIDDVKSDISKLRKGVYFKGYVIVSSLGGLAVMLLAAGLSFSNHLLLLLLCIPAGIAVSFAARAAIKFGAAIAGLRMVETSAEIVAGSMDKTPEEFYKEAAEKFSRIMGD